MVILLLTATDFEQARLVEALEEPVCLRVAGRAWRRGRIAGRQVQLVETGVGAANSAHAVTRALEAEACQPVLQVGVAGAYLDAGPEVGDLAVASEEIYGDLGVVTPAGWRGAREIGLPVAHVGGHERYNRFPLSEQLTAGVTATLRAAGLGAGVHRGPFVTVQACSGTDSLGRERARRVAGALCESMEGAAAAHVCALYGAAFAEVRAVSNLVQDRDPSAWDLPGAAARAQAAALALIDDLAGWWTAPGGAREVS